MTTTFPLSDESLTIWDESSTLLTTISGAPPPHPAALNASRNPSGAKNLLAAKRIRTIRDEMWPLGGCSAPEQLDVGDLKFVNDTNLGHSQCSSKGGPICFRFNFHSAEVDMRLKRHRLVSWRNLEHPAFNFVV